MTRADGRKNDALRKINILTGIQKDPAGSVQISFGNTVVLCAATFAEEVPAWLKRKGDGSGWITAEYSMLPGSTPGRVPRRKRGRSEEIQRLIGRSLRAAYDLAALGPRTVTVDCDVIQADGGTRTAGITGGFVAVEMAVRKLVAGGKLPASPSKGPVCAVSCAVVDGQVLLDPDYSEDSAADVDMNFVMSGENEFIEVQGTAEGKPFDKALLDRMIELARLGAPGLFEAQQGILRG
ncbi:MAG TPA: ribonuclease PH [Myxococcota bacterium]|nr:ribonuclease PH [Myxococcota bacterium]